jgi:alkylhydroperoxidase/carboxymuconolactone decarboxylase family protein YurZ
VATAQALRDAATALLSSRVGELLGGAGALSGPAPVSATSRTHELVALGASVGANSHALLHLHVRVAGEVGLSLGEIGAALRMAQYVQQRASEITVERATRALEELGAAAAAAAARS